ncbi:apolipoprotein D-like [Girardinichthys multiradiatus]|uniref:apolipoprotein D-like n=1 Tax=Girardinichthys multiradiatus TaxID=208333 RepID=UPI001FABBC36|nr:apolipoprotein D-like [Girardinichthys multiradiatus]
MGTWYEIEKIPSYFDNGKCLELSYQGGKGEKIVVEGTAKILDPREPGKLGVSFFCVTPYSPYWVLTTDYTNVTIVYSCTDFLSLFHLNFVTILSHSPFLPNEMVHHAKELLMSEGIDVSEMEPTKQDCHEDHEDHHGSEEE